MSVECLVVKREAIAVGRTCRICYLEQKQDSWDGTYILKDKTAMRT